MSCFDQRIFFKQTPSSFLEGTQDGVSIQDVVNFLNASPQVNNTIGMSNVSVDNLFNTIASYPGEAGMSLDPSFSTSQPHEMYEFLNMAYFQNLEPTLSIIGDDFIEVGGQSFGILWQDPDTGQTFRGQYMKPYFNFPSGQDYMTNDTQSSSPYMWRKWPGYVAEDLNNSIFMSIFLEDGRILGTNAGGFVAPNINSITGLWGQDYPLPNQNFYAVMDGNWSRSGDDLILTINPRYGYITFIWNRIEYNITWVFNWSQAKPTTEKSQIIQKDNNLGNFEQSINSLSEIYIYPFCIGEGMNTYSGNTVPVDSCLINMKGFFRDPATAIGTWTNTNPARKSSGPPYGNWPFQLLETDANGDAISTSCNFFNYIYEYGCGSVTSSNSSAFYIDAGATAFDPEQDDISGNIKVRILELDIETYLDSGEVIWNDMQDENGNYIGLFGLVMTSGGQLQVAPGYVHQQNWQTPIPLAVPAGYWYGYQIQYYLFDDCYFENTQGFGYDGLKFDSRIVIING